MPEGKPVEIKPAKGRPHAHLGRQAAVAPRHRLSRRSSSRRMPLRRRRPLVADPEAWAGWPNAYPPGGLLFHGDNKDVLAHLLANGFRGKVNLIYIDPPFDSGADYVRKVTLRGATGTAKIDGEAYTLGEQIQYTDIWANDNYLQFMYERLLLLKELLAEDGSAYLHCDQRRAHQLRCLMDEAFGAQNLVAELVRQRSDSHNDATYFGIVHDTILAYSKSGAPLSTRILPADITAYCRQLVSTCRGRDWPQIQSRNLVSPHPRPNLMYAWKGIKPPAMGWRVSKERMAELDLKGLAGSERSRRERNPEGEAVLGREQGTATHHMVGRSQSAQRFGADDEKTDYPTQKPDGLLERISHCVV